MIHHKYDVSWVGIDAGREGLWQEPVWTRVIELVEKHQGEKVYDPESPIYAELIAEFPTEKWCSLTPEKTFRPLFRDYPNSWTRTGVISLQERRFWLTNTGRDLLDGITTKSKILIDLFSKHKEESIYLGKFEYPFAIISQAFLETPRALTAKEVYWLIMKNYRPGEEVFKEVFDSKIKFTPEEPEPTPYRRVRHMLQLLRAADTIESYRRGHQVYWAPRDEARLKDIVESSI